MLLYFRFVINALDRAKKKRYNVSNKLEKESQVESLALLKTVAVYTENEYLFQKIRLELSGIAEVILMGEDTDGIYDVALVDGDNPAFVNISGLQMKRGGGDISLPFRVGTLRALLEKEKKSFIEVIDSQKSVRVGKNTVRLTELEYSLFSLLYERGGEYVSREEILSKVWDGRADKGIINVYVHYLREKLECEGEKIILSSRNYGYKINEKYLGGEVDA